MNPGSNGTTTKYRFLSRDQEVEFCAAMDAGCSAARDRLIESILGWGENLARTFCERAYWNDYEEAKSAAYEGCIRAVDMFDATEGSRLVTYSRAWIINYIMRAHHRRHVIDVPFRSPYTIGKFQDDIDAATNMGRLSSDSPIPHKSGTSGPELVEIRDEIDHLLQEITVSMPGVNDRNRDVYVDRIFSGMTFREIGLKYSVTRQRAQQIYVRMAEKFSNCHGGNEG